MTQLSGADDVGGAPWLERISSRQWVAVDIAVAAFTATVFVVHFFVLPHAKQIGPPGTNRWVLGSIFLVAAVPLAWRRIAPMSAMILVGGATVATTVLGHTLAPAPLLAFPLYTIAITRTRRQSLITLAGVEGAILVALLVAAHYHRAEGDVTFNLLLALATWFIGDSIRTRRVFRRALAAQAAERQRQEIDEAHRAITEERLEIARELHDILAHSLSVIAIQSGVGRHVIDQQPEDARRALATVEETSRQSLDELRRVITVLRRATVEPDTPLEPTPSLSDVTELIGRVRATGMTVAWRLDGTAPNLPLGLELSIYRIIQEALTNVVKHADGADTAVEVRFREGDVLISVVNQPGPRRHTATVGGTTHGLIGMRERAIAFGGTLDAHARPDGGFEVTAVLRTVGDS